MNETIRVLYVEGERAEGATAESLESAGCEVLRAEGGPDAIRRLRAERVDCVVFVGEPTRLPVAGFVRRVRSEVDGIPVILVGHDPERAIRGLRAGAVSHVPRGLEARRNLLDRVREVVSRRRTDEAIDRHRRLESLSFEALRRAVAATTRAGAELGLREAFAASDLYRSAWVGTYDDGVLELREPFEASVDADALAGEGDPVRRAVAEDDVVEAPGSDGLGIVPLSDPAGVEGVLVLAADRRDAFDRAERALLADLGDALGGVLGDRRDAPPETGSNRRFAEELAHELRGALGVLSAQLDLARESGAEASLDRASRALRRIDRTIEDVLAVAGENPVGEVWAGDLADDAETAWERIDAPASTLRIEDAPTIRADHDAVVRLLANLFRNAVEHGSAGRSRATGGVNPGSSADPERPVGGGGDLSSSIEGQRPSGGAGTGPADGGDVTDEVGVTVRIGPLEGGFYVEDDGPGIPEAERDRVFEWGYSTATSGSGIGLAVVREIAEAHGWTIDVREGERGGARFELSGVETSDSPFSWGHS